MQVLEKILYFSQRKYQYTAMRKIFFLLLFTSLIISNGYSQDFKIEWLDGTWTGTGYQADDQRWSIELQCDYRKNSFSIFYPSLGCRGTWEPNRADACRMVFEEKIDHGSCDSFTIVTLMKIDEDHVSISYVVPSFSEEIIAYSVLKRKK